MHLRSRRICSCSSSAYPLAARNFSNPCQIYMSIRPGTALLPPCRPILHRSVFSLKSAQAGINTSCIPGHIQLPGSVLKSFHESKCARPKAGVRFWRKHHHGRPTPRRNQHRKRSRIQVPSRYHRPDPGLPGDMTYPPTPPNLLATLAVLAPSRRSITYPPPPHSLATLAVLAPPERSSPFRPSNDR